MSELWKIIPNFSDYEVSTLGNIRNKKTLKELSKKSLSDGYIRLSIKHNDGMRKTITLHRLIALTFIPNPENKYTVNHINHNKLDNRVENLEWATTREQNRHKRKVPKAKQRLISSRKVWRIDKYTNEKIELYETIRDASKWVFDNQLTSIKVFNNGNNIKTKICAVCRKKRKTSFGFIWNYDINDIDKYEDEDEIWKPIPNNLIHNTDGYYISSHGRVKNHKGRITEGHYKPNNYRWVSIYPKQYLLHRLVAKVFLPNYYDNKIVNHKDGNKTNSKLYNLEWCSHSENSQHAHDILLNEISIKIKVTNIITNKIEIFPSISSFNRATNISNNKCSYALKNNKLINNLYRIEYM
tara:strand:+ start:670 stop:1731 length:1062 start_codon:yes stop_codon:yes gene_type:complete